MLLWGSLPPAESMAAILKEEPAPISASAREVPAELETVIVHCLEKRAEDRHFA